MKEISLHILDIAQNSIRAGANLIEINIWEDSLQDRLEIKIKDNGCGMSSDELLHACDIFFTTRSDSAVKAGRGLFLLRSAARKCSGDVIISSKPGLGACIRAFFQYSHPDRAPVGDMAATMEVLVTGYPEMFFIYKHRVDSQAFHMDTREFRPGAGKLS